MDKKNHGLGNLANRKTGFPAATIAYYGPDNQFASKVVVGILPSEKQREIKEQHKWFAEGTDVRQDARILREMLEYIQSNQVQRVVMVDRIIGCPHEEGVDYPAGESCPHCPYWANRDRWTGELLNGPDHDR